MTKTETKEEMNGDDSSYYLLQKKMEMLMEMQNKKVNQEIQALKEGFNQIIMKIQKIESDLKTGTVKQGVQQEIKQEISQEPQLKIEKINVQSDEKPEETQGYGEYSPEDVSVEKFFNFANK